MQQQVAEAARRLTVASELTAEQRRRRRQVQADAAQRLWELEVQVAECRARLAKGLHQRGNHGELQPTSLILPLSDNLKRFPFLLRPRHFGFCVFPANSWPFTPSPLNTIDDQFIWFYTPVPKRL